MKKDEVPQHNAKAFEGQSKALYAIDENGEYGIVPSSGWDVEEIVLDQAIAEFEQLCEQAQNNIQLGLASTLQYHMYRCRMDETVLAQSSGFFKWQVKRHLKPKPFARLSESKKQRYAQALGISINELNTLPDLPDSK
jgi:hypothetical protein